ncbi:diguanylate cyclase domain-containing protein [Paenibacillus sp. OSY-SE]|uniref:diguanylate cyclase domain-containing protein n=1 Tax=Paenibacillus sp. OSY-SE TaxID=1196323 RepID=UPI0002D2782B|nr:diguanylate cyclase [Paenibacillus sp. OSY-SE]
MGLCDSQSDSGTSMMQRIEKWRRKVQDSGLNPASIPQFNSVMGQSEFVCKRIFYDEMLTVVRFFTGKLLTQLAGTPIVIVISDENGCILEMAGDGTMKQTVAQLGIVAGVRFTEEACGTNGITLALTYGKPVQLAGEQHFHHCFHDKVCYSVPFGTSDEDNLLGTVSIMTSMEYAHPYFMAVLNTVADSIERELLLRSQNRKLNILNHIMMDTTRNGIIITDRHGRITEFNSYAEQLTGLSRNALIQQPVFDIKPMGPYIDEVIRTGKTCEDIEVVVCHTATGARQVCLFDALPILDEHGNRTGAFGQFRDITERVEAEGRYNYLAYHDDLTGLPNRRHYKEHVAQLIAKAKKDKQMMAVLYLDLDRFKQVNDTLGHSKGDYLLQEVAARMRTFLPAEMMMRMGGDEFIILLPNIRRLEDAQNTAQEVLQLFEEDFMIAHYQFRLTTSIGIAIFPHDGLDAETLLTHADMAMYEAKMLGNGYAVYSPAMARNSPEKLSMAPERRRAL